MYVCMYVCMYVFESRQVLHRMHACVHTCMVPCHHLTSRSTRMGYTYYIYTSGHVYVHERKYVSTVCIEALYACIYACMQV